MQVEQVENRRRGQFEVASERTSLAFVYSGPICTGMAFWRCTESQLLLCEADVADQIVKARVGTQGVKTGIDSEIE